MMLVTRCCIQQVSVNLIRPFCPRSTTANVLGLLLQISVFFGDLVLLRFLLAIFPHLDSSSPAEVIKFRYQEHVTFPTCVGAAFHLLVPKQIDFTNSLQILQGNDVAAQNVQKDAQCRIKHCRPSAKNFLCLIPQQDPRLLDVT